jgi:hypothetical protein
MKPLKRLLSSLVVLGISSSIYHSRILFYFPGRGDDVHWIDVIDVIPTNVSLNTASGYDTVTIDTSRTSLEWIRSSQHQQPEHFLHQTTNTSHTTTDSTTKTDSGYGDIPICFITANYGQNVSDMDRLSNVSQLNW